MVGARIRKGARIGPFARFRPGADIGAGAHVGNFVEVKNATLEDGRQGQSSRLHRRWRGSAEGANIGAGTIFCNYDGFNKHFTDVGKGVFVGSNTSLVAPVKVGDGAYIGSGSVISKDVAPDALALERGGAGGAAGLGRQIPHHERRKKHARLTHRKDQATELELKH